MNMFALNILGSTFHSCNCAPYCTVPCALVQTVAQFLVHLCVVPFLVRLCVAQQVSCVKQGEKCVFVRISRWPQMERASPMAYPPLRGLQIEKSRSLPANTFGLWRKPGRESVNGKSCAPSPQRKDSLQWKTFGVPLSSPPPSPQRTLAAILGGGPAHQGGRVRQVPQARVAHHSRAKSQQVSSTQWVKDRRYPSRTNGKGHCFKKGVDMCTNPTLPEA